MRTTILLVWGLVLFAPRVSATNKLVCPLVLRDLLEGRGADKYLPVVERYAMGEGVWLYKYADNLWGLAGENDHLDRVAQSVLFANNPTPGRSDILYLFAHGIEKVPGFGTGEPSKLFRPMEVWKKLEEVGGSPASRASAIVLLSCHGCQDRSQDPQHPHSTGEQISAFSGGLPVIGPTGYIQISGHSYYSSPNLRIFVDGHSSDPQETGWRIVEAEASGIPKREPVVSLSTEELRQISGFYREWEAYSREAGRNERTQRRLEESRARRGAN